MTQQAVLIAAFSGRALAASARRAGYAPLVVDCFGDADLASFAEHSICLPARVQVGFKTKPLLAALASLQADASSKPIGLVLGAGFECAPRLIARLAERFPLLGNDAARVARAKDPEHLTKALEALGVRHPETSTAPPANPDGWLMKRIGGSGGLHIVPCPDDVRPDKRRYFQRHLENGAAVSVTVIAGKESAAFALSRQWCQPLKRRPFRYGGAVSAISVCEETEQTLVSHAYRVAEHLELEGLVSVDFLLHDGTPYVLEVNPRPGAALEVLDDEQGSLFEAHVRCFTEGDPAAYLKDNWRPATARAQAYLYADEGDITIGGFDWPDWTADRPQPGSHIRRRQPLATVLAEGTSDKAAEQLCRQRLATLNAMLYDREKWKETKQ